MHSPIAQIPYVPFTRAELQPEARRSLVAPARDIRFCSLNRDGPLRYSTSAVGVRKGDDANLEAVY